MQASCCTCCSNFAAAARPHICLYAGARNLFDSYTASYSAMVRCASHFCGVSLQLAQRCSCTHAPPSSQYPSSCGSRLSELCTLTACLKCLRSCLGWVTLERRATPALRATNGIRVLPCWVPCGVRMHCTEHIRLLGCGYETASRHQRSLTSCSCCASKHTCACQMRSDAKQAVPRSSMRPQHISSIACGLALTCEGKSRRSLQRNLGHLSTPSS